MLQRFAKKQKLLRCSLSPSRKRAQPKKCDTTDIQRKVSCQTGPSISPKMTSLVVTLRSFESLNFDRSAYVGQPRTRQSRSINASQCGSWDDVIRDGKERLGAMRNGHLQEVVCLILSEGLFVDQSKGYTGQEEGTKLANPRCFFSEGSWKRAMQATFWTVYVI